MTPKKMFLTTGTGRHKNALHSFELSLRGANIQKCNLVNVSSIIPPQCEIIPKEKAIKLIQPGEITYCVLSKNKTKKKNEKIGAGIGIAVPKEKNKYGYISEYHCNGIKCKDIGKKVKNVAKEMLQTTVGVSPSHIKADGIATTTESKKENEWLTVIAAALFIEK